MIIKKIPISSINPAPYNPRLDLKPGDPEYEKLKKSITEFDLVEPLVWNERSGNLVGGHQRLKILIDRGDTDVEVSVVDLDKQKEKILNIALNKIQGDWDEIKLYELLKEIKISNFDLEITGFTDYELAQYANEFEPDKHGLTEPDVVPVDIPSRSKKGDIWELGNHRLLCGDCTNAQDVKLLFKSEKAVLMNTDPPYGINYGDIANSRLKAIGNKKDYEKQPYPDIENDDLDGEELQKFLEASIQAAIPFLIENPAFYLWHPMLTQGIFFAAAAAADIIIHRQIIWVKPSLIMGRGDYHWRHELCFYGWIQGKRPAWYAGRDQDTVWEIGRELDNVHPTQKPIELFLRPIKNHTKEGEIVYEPFAGSGSQYVAAEQTGRRCYGLEIDPHYCDVIIKRWEDFTGKKAIKNNR